MVVALVVIGIVGVAAYFVLRRMFERTAARVADDLGRVLAEVATRGRTAPSGVRSGVPPRRPSGPTSRFRAYAAAHGISEEQARREFAESIERLAHVMDAAVHVPGLGPVGLDALLGLFPVAGDVLSAAVSVSLIARSLRYGVPPEIIARMLANVLVDLLVGAVPVVGDLADVLFRANLRNVALLREYLERERDGVIDITATRVS